MPLSKLYELFSGSDHKKLMLTGLLAATSLLFTLFAVVALLMGHDDIFFTKILLAAVLLILLIKFQHSENTTFYALMFLGVVECESFSAMFGGHFYDFVTIFPFFAVFGFFYFFSLRTALWLTFGHFVTWTVTAIIVYDENAANPVFHHVPLLNMLSTTFVVIAIAFLYHISTELTYQQLEKADRQKTVLIQEIHHRIKNNLNRISSIIGLQIASLPKGSCEHVAAEILQKNQSRIEAMAMVHEAIYRSDDLEHIDSKKYIGHLVDTVCRSHGTHPPVALDVEILFLSLEKMMRIGIILNELCTNSVKHLSDTENASVHIAFNLDRGQYTLVYTQTSSTAPVLPEADDRQKGIGLTLIRLSAEEMDGTFDIRLEGNTLIFTVVFSATA